MITKKMTIKKTKKAQMKMQQMAFMLIAVTLFFVIAGLFILTIGIANLKHSAAILNENNAVLLASKIADTPEFSCENAFGLAMTNCIDMDKVMALQGRAQEYNGFWGISGLEIRKVYPAPGQDVECDLYNYPDCSTITLVPFTSGTGKSSFVSLCRKEYENLTYDKCELGKVIVVYNG